MRRNTTREEHRRARAETMVRVAALAVAGVVIWLALLLGDEPPKETDDYARFKAQEEYYRMMELYHDAEGATEAARLVWEELAENG